MLSKYRIFVETDFSSFESSFTLEFMKMCEFKLYRYMYSLNPHHLTQIEFIIRVISGKNILQFKKFRAIVRAVRMSGETNTSLGNGFSNLMLMLFYAYKHGLTTEGACEGDDGNFGFYDMIPDPGGFFEKLGFTLKFKIVDDLSQLMFCSTIYSHGCNMIDYKKPLLTTGWVKACYRDAKDSKIKQLWKAKLLSLYARINNKCPIVSAFCLAYLRLNGSRPLMGVKSQYEIEQYLLIDKNPDLNVEIDIPYGAREIYARKFGVSPESQVHLEAMFLNLTEADHYNTPIDDLLFPASYFNYNDNFTTYNFYSIMPVVRQNKEKSINDTIVKSKITQYGSTKKVKHEWWDDETSHACR